MYSMHLGCTLILCGWRDRFFFRVLPKLRCTVAQLGGLPGEGVGGRAAGGS